MSFQIKKIRTKRSENFLEFLLIDFCSNSVLPAISVTGIDL